MDNGKVQELILQALRDNASALKDLDEKLDRKIDILHGRITQEADLRRSLEVSLNEFIGHCTAKIKGLGARMSWLYVIVGGLTISMVTAALAIIFKG